MIYPVGWDGQMLPVEARNSVEAKYKLEQHLLTRDYKIGLITVYSPSDGYSNWVKNMNIEVIK